MDLIWSKSMRYIFNYSLKEWMALMFQLFQSCARSGWSINWLIFVSNEWWTVGSNIEIISDFPPKSLQLMQLLPHTTQRSLVTLSSAAGARRAVTQTISTQMLRWLCRYITVQSFLSIRGWILVLNNILFYQCHYSYIMMFEQIAVSNHYPVQL